MLAAATVRSAFVPKRLDDGAVEAITVPIDTGVQVYFCDPKPLAAATCDAVAAQLDNRPRTTLGYLTPLQSWTQLRALTA